MTFESQRENDSCKNKLNFEFRVKINNKEKTLSIATRKRGGHVCNFMIYKSLSAKINNNNNNNNNKAKMLLKMSRLKKDCKNVTETISTNSCHVP